MSAPLPRAAARVLYREILRATANGLRPEALTVPGSWSTPSFADAKSLPSSSQEVRGLLRRGFSEASATLDPFAALRSASANSRALHPTLAGLPGELPAFVLPSHVLLPGERADFMLFEPRYVALARAALGSEGSAGDADGRYAHLDGSGGFGTITTIQLHRWLPDGRVASA